MTSYDRFHPVPREGSRRHVSPAARQRHQDATPADYDLEECPHQHVPLE